MPDTTWLDKLLGGSGGAGQLTIPTLADVSLVPVTTYSSGQLAFVSPGYPRALFRLNKEVTRDPVDGVYLAVFGGVGTWERMAITDPGDLASSDWGLDDEGLVTNSGASDSPIPGAEWVRRCCNPIYTPAVQRVDIAVAADTALPACFVDPGDSVIAFTGTPIDTGLSGTMSGVVVGSVPDNQLWHATLAGMTVYLSDQSPFILVTSGDNAGNGMWAVPDGSAMTANDIPLLQPSDWGDDYSIGGTQVIEDGDPWAAYELPILDVTNLKIMGAQGVAGPGGTGFVTFETLHVRGVAGSFLGYLGQISGFGIVYVYAKHCFFEKLSGSNILSTVGCKFDTYVPQSALAGLTAYAGLFVGGGLYFANNATSFLHSGCVIVGPIFATGGSNINWRSGYAVNCEFVSPINTQDGSILRFDGHTLGGYSNVLPILQMGAGTQCLGLDGDGIYAESDAEVPIHIEDEWSINVINDTSGLPEVIPVNASFGVFVGGNVGAVNLKHNVHFSPSPTGP